MSARTRGFHRALGVYLRQNYRLLRGWRRDRLVGRVWVRFNVHPYRAATARSYVRGVV